MADNRTISQLEAEGYPWIGCECRKGTVWVPWIPMLSAVTLDQLGAKMRCDKCGKRPELAQSCKAERHGRFEGFRLAPGGRTRCLYVA